MIKEERRSKLGSEPSTGFNKCNELMLRFERRRKRFEGSSATIPVGDFTDGCCGKRQDGETKMSNNQRGGGKRESEETRKITKEEVQNWYKDH